MIGLSPSACDLRTARYGKSEIGFALLSSGREQMSIFMNIRKSHLMIQGGAYPLAFPTGAMTPKNLPRRKERAMSNDTIELNFKAGTFEEAISQAIVAAQALECPRAKLSISS
jgi:L-aminopeptidase/D-esterase-like protein